MEWTGNKPTEPGWYLWFRKEYDMMRKEFFIIQGSPGYLTAFPGNKHIDHIVGGLWYGPIPTPPIADITDR